MEKKVDDQVRDEEMSSCHASPCEPMLAAGTMLRSTQDHRGAVGRNSSPKTCCGVLDPSAPDSRCSTRYTGYIQPPHICIAHKVIRTRASPGLHAAPEPACQRPLQLWDPVLTAILYSETCELVLPDHLFLNLHRRQQKMLAMRCVHEIFIIIQSKLRRAQSLVMHKSPIKNHFTYSLY